MIPSRFDPLSLLQAAAASASAQRAIGHYLDVANLQARLLERISGSDLGEAELLNPLDGAPHARFLAFRSPHAQRWCNELDAQNIVADVRGDVLRIGFGLYQDEADVDALAAAARQLA